MADRYRVGIPAPRSPHHACVCATCTCCVEVRADLVEAALDVADAWMAGGSWWADMTREQPHPSMRRLLDAAHTLDHRHHGGRDAPVDAAQTVVNVDW